MNKKVLIFSKKEFDEICILNGWNDKSVESITDKAFISIGTDNTSHLFASNHFNVLNLDFDDIGEQDLDNDVYKKFSNEMADTCIEFIERNLGKSFYIHCLAGISRSQAFFRFITDFYKDFYSEKCGRLENPCITPNLYIVGGLKKAFYKKLYK